MFSGLKGLFKTTEQRKKNEANEFIKKQQNEKKEKEEKEINSKKKYIEGKILYNSKQELNLFKRNLNFRPKISQKDKTNLYEKKKKN